MTSERFQSSSAVTPYVFKVHAYESAGETQKVYALFDQMVGYFKYTGS